MSSLKHTSAANGATLPHPDGIAPIHTLPTSLAAEVWRLGAPDECAYFAALAWSISDETGETLARLRITDFKHPISACVYQAATAVQARGAVISSETLAEECAHRGDECDRQSEATQWENARDAVAALETAPKGNADRLAVELTDRLAPKQRFALHTLADLRQRPAPEWLIERVITKGATSLLTAKHQSFKSFFALDMALCIATGTRWQGFNVAPGAVVYVAAEGAAGLRKRADAWEEHHGVNVGANFAVIDVPLKIHDAATRAAFIAEIATLKPALIVLDTLARCAVGLEENDSGDMGIFADAVGAVAVATGAHVMTVHHNNRTGDYRGSSALPAAVDTHLSLERRGDSAMLKTEKQKDFEELETLSFESQTVTLPNTRGADTSLVFTRIETGNGSAFSLSDAEEKALDELRENYGNEGATASQWGADCEAVGIPARTFRRAKERLVKMEAVLCPNKGERGARFTVSTAWGQGAK